VSLTTGEPSDKIQKQFDQYEKNLVEFD